MVICRYWLNSYPERIIIIVPINKGYVYILTGDRHRSLYIGVTSNLVSRVKTHKIGGIRGFSKRYHITRLVYYERFDDINDAIRREKQLKKWRRSWKMKLITKNNSNWRDLFDDIITKMAPDNDASE